MSQIEILDNFGIHNVQSGLQEDQDQEQVDRAKIRKTFKKMMFMYMALLQGWQIHMLKDGKFHLSRNTSTLL